MIDSIEWCNVCNRDGYDNGGGKYNYDDGVNI